MNPLGFAPLDYTPEPEKATIALQPKYEYIDNFIKISFDKKENKSDSFWVPGLNDPVILSSIELSIHENGKDVNNIPNIKVTNQDYIVFEGDRYSDYFISGTYTLDSEVNFNLFIKSELKRPIEKPSITKPPTTVNLMEDLIKVRTGSCFIPRSLDLNHHPVTTRNPKFDFRKDPETPNLPQTSVSLPQTSVSLPQTSVSLPQTSVSLPQTSVSLPQISVSLPDNLSESSSKSAFEDLTNEALEDFTKDPILENLNNAKVSNPHLETQIKELENKLKELRKKSN